MDIQAEIDFRGSPGRSPSCKPLCELMGKNNFSPQDLANYYEELIQVTGIGSAAFIVATSKRSNRETP